MQMGILVGACRVQLSQQDVRKQSWWGQARRQPLGRSGGRGIVLSTIAGGSHM